VVPAPERLDVVMAMKIVTDHCTGCGACEHECPNNAISRKGRLYAIAPGKCTECKGDPDGPQCAGTCEAECIEKEVS